MSFEYIHANRKKFEKMFDNIKGKLYTKSDNCGMHIHVSKKAFTTFHFLSLLNFFIMQKKYGLLVRVAGRGSNHYATIKAHHSSTGAKPNVFETQKHLTYQEAHKKGLPRKLRRNYEYSGERYDCINITIKIRMRCVSLKEQRLTKNL